MLKVPTKPRTATGPEWSKWKQAARKKYPVRWFLSETIPIAFARAYRKWLKDPWYYLKCLVWHQYHVVRCEKLQPTWHDRSELIMHVAFQCLVDFVEKEHPWELEATLEEFKEAYNMNPEDGEHQYHLSQELSALYHWWKAYDGYGENDALENEKLKRLIELRGHMWT